jgi:protein gp37
VNKTSIEWTRGPNGEQGYTWNTVTGCTHVSDGCRNCYAEALSLRFKRSAHPWTKPFEAENVKLHPERLAEPLRVKSPGFVFADSMADLFHDLVPDQHIIDVFAVIALTPHLTYQILTKRPERMAKLLRGEAWGGLGTLTEEVAAAAYRMGRQHGIDRAGDRYGIPWPLPNVWLGTSVEDQRVVERIEWLAATPAAVRFLSCEPLIGPLDLSMWLLEGPCRNCGKPSHLGYCEDPKPLPITWVITGGESGPGHRPCDPDWVRSIRDQCQAAGVAYFP